MAPVRPTRVARLPLSVALRWSVGLSLLLTVLFVAVLSVRMAAGADPALGPKIVNERSTAQGQQAAIPSQEPAPASIVPVAPATVPVAPQPVAPQPVAPVQTSAS